jgi:hypothetical protein
MHPINLSYRGLGFVWDYETLLINAPMAKLGPEVSSFCRFPGTELKLDGMEGRRREKGAEIYADVLTV